jgi:hypothetical protein
MKSTGLTLNIAPIGDFDALVEQFVMRIQKGQGVKPSHQVKGASFQTKSKRGK